MTLRPYRAAIWPEAKIAIAALSPVTKRSIRAAIDKVLIDPYASKPLVKELAGYRRFRVGRMRLVFKIRPDRVVEFVGVGPRHSIYEDMIALVARESLPE